ncbi:MAG: membrane lipoprotein lipid attachment site-containing protein [Proteobacteria bacterium]|nr:membrane lipoprotein lipid attachment site-containing protein [Pseudomonadota bacterium]
MKKLFIFATAALLLSGCAEENTDSFRDCAHGHLSGAQCLCDPGYTVNLTTGACSIALDQVDALCGYGQYAGNQCICYPGYVLDPQTQKCISTTKDCGYGTSLNGTCICNDGYLIDSTGRCTIWRKRRRTGISTAASRCATRRVTFRRATAAGTARHTCPTTAIWHGPRSSARITHSKENAER